MDGSFDPDKFIRRIGERLVDEFRDAKAGTTSSTVGAAAEQPVRKQLTLCGCLQAVRGVDRLLRWISRRDTYLSRRQQRAPDGFRLFLDHAQ